MRVSRAYMHSPPLVHPMLRISRHRSCSRARSWGEKKTLFSPICSQGREGARIRRICPRLDCYRGVAEARGPDADGVLLSRRQNLRDCCKLGVRPSEASRMSASTMPMDEALRERSCLQSLHLRRLLPTLDQPRQADSRKDGHRDRPLAKGQLRLNLEQTHQARRWSTAQERPSLQYCASLRTSVFWRHAGGRCRHPGALGVHAESTGRMEAPVRRGRVVRPEEHPERGAGLGSSPELCRRRPAPSRRPCKLRTRTWQEPVCRRLRTRTQGVQLPSFSLRPIWHPGACTREPPSRAWSLVMPANMRDLHLNGYSCSHR